MGEVWPLSLLPCVGRSNARNSRLPSLSCPWQGFRQTFGSIRHSALSPPGAGRVVSRASKLTSLPR